MENLHIKYNINQMSHLYFDKKVVRIANTFMGIMLALDRFLQPVQCWCGAFVPRRSNPHQCRYCGHNNAAAQCVCACCNAARRQGWVMDPG